MRKHVRYSGTNFVNDRILSNYQRVSHSKFDTDKDCGCLLESGGDFEGVLGVRKKV